MKNLLFHIVLALCHFRTMSTFASEDSEPEMRSNPTERICDDFLPPPDDCWDKPGGPLLQIRYPKEMRTGACLAWTPDFPPWEGFELALEHTADITSLWGRLEYDGKIIVIHVPNIMVYGPLREDVITMNLIWRARGIDNGLALVADEVLQGDIRFRLHEPEEGPKSHMDFTLGGANMGRASWVEARQEKPYSEAEEKRIAQKIRTEWEGMANDEKKADLQKVIADAGIIYGPGKQEL